MAARIYLVHPIADGKSSRLVRATHPATALRHVANDAFKVAVASQDQLVEAIGRGVKVEDVAHEQGQLPTT